MSFLITVLILAAYLYLAFKPFQWFPPQRIDNGAVQLEDQTIWLPTQGIVRTKAAAEWLPEAIRANRLAVRLRVRTAWRGQWGPACILTVSGSSNLRNLTIAQGIDELVVRLRTAPGAVDGQPELRIPGVFDKPGWRLIELTVRPGSLAVSVDQRPVLNTELPEAPLQYWDRSFRLALGNEMSGDRPWLGRVSQVTFMVGDREYDYLEQGVLEIPARYWAGVNFHPYYSIAYLTRDIDRLQDAILNLICFVPLGFFAANSSRHPKRFFYAVFLCCLASLLVEVAQIGAYGRSPSVVDWILNTVGAGLGAILAEKLSAATRGTAGKPGRPARGEIPAAD